MIKNYIFDFGKVIVEFEPEYMVSPYISDKAIANKVGKIVFDRLYWDKLDAGTITDDEVKQGINSRLPESLYGSACAIYDNWYKHLPFIAGMPELLKRIKESGGKLFLISNISKTFAAKYSDVKEFRDLFKIFDGLVFSAPLGLTKPDKDIFKYLLKKYDIMAQESIFIDDNKDNIIGAESIGISGYLFDGNVELLKQFLKI